ncbi:MAG: DNA polymerase III subunit beta [Planctomycetota bacterium]|jgi:DNA polymerase-3 subunit beta|nr:DNA polymerase III subunit beta [Planctomycetota bacterium]
MEFSIDKTAFSETLSLIVSVIPERSIRTVLQNLFLKGNADNTLTMRGTDLDIGLKITLDARNLREPGEILLPAMELNSRVKNSRGDELFFTIAEQRAEIRTNGGNRYTINGMGTDDYPIMPDVHEGGYIGMHGDELADAVQKTIFATAKGDTSYALNGVYVSFDGDSAEFVASDTSRLSRVKKDIKNSGAKGTGIIIPKGMNILAHLASGLDMVELALTEKALMAKTPNAAVVVQLVEGVFPRYRDVIPAKSDCYFTVKREELLDILQSVAPFSTDSRTVLFELHGESLFLSSKTGDGSEAHGGLAVEPHGPDIALGFNYNYIMDGLKHIGDETVSIQYKDANSPARIDSCGFLYILMPIQR